MLPGLSPRFALAAVLLATLCVFAPAFGNGYAMDDALVARGPMVDGVRPLGEYFASDYWAGAGQRSGLYRPATILSFALTNALRRGPPGDDGAALPHHALNVLLHLGAVLAVFALLRALGARALPAVAGAAVFALHPIHSEVVATIVGRAELLAFVCGASAVLAHLRARRARAAPAAWLSLAAAALLLAAFASKESALAWAPFLAVAGFAAAPQRTPGALGRELAAAARVAAVPLIAFLALRARMLAGLGDVPPVEWIANPLAHCDSGARMGTALALWGEGLLRTVLPLPCRADYGPHVGALADGAFDGRSLVAMVVLGAVLLGALASARRRPLLLAAGAAFLGFSFLTSNAPFPIGTIFGERLYYAPSLGLSFAVAALAERGGRLVPLALGAWLLAAAAIAAPRAAVWKDDATLFCAEAESNPRAVRMLVCAAIVHEVRGERAQAETLVRRALALAPDWALAWNNLGALRLAAGDLDGAQAALQRGLAAPRDQRSARPLLEQTRAAVGAARERALPPAPR